MTLKQQLIALYTLIRRELVRMFRIFSQVFLPPMITTLLYFLIFGRIIGSRIGQIEHVDYGLFIAPGLIMMAVITNAYSNVTTSLFSMRFQKSIEEMLVSPMPNGLLLLGFTLGGILRGILVAFLVFFVASYFVDFNLTHWIFSLFIIALVAALFSLAGFTNALLAKTFDDVALVPTFVLTPLTYLGGVFYSTNMLPPFWQKVSYFNPIFYMVDALRQTMIPNQTLHLVLSLSVIGLILIALLTLNLTLLRRGSGLRE